MILAWTIIGLHVAMLGWIPVMIHFVRKARREARPADCICAVFFRGGCGHADHAATYWAHGLVETPWRKEFGALR